MRLALGAALAVAATLLPTPRLEWVESAVSVRVGVEPVAAQEAPGVPGAPDVAPPGVDQEDRLQAASPAPGEFTMIGVSPERPTDEPIFVRTRADGVWTEWMEVEHSVDDGPDPGTAEERASRADGAAASEPIWVGTADAFEVNLPDEARDADVVVVRTEERAQVVSPAVEPAGADIPGPTITSRASWGARAPKSSPTYGSGVRLGVVHHSASANGYAAADVPAILRSLQAYHMDGQGWSDLGYNFVVDRFGRIWEGRAGGTDRAVVGAHAAGFNTNTVGVMVLGEYTNEVPSALAVDAAGEILGWRMFLDGVDPSGSVAFTSGGSNTVPAGVTRTYPRVIGHRDVGSTACPGNQLYGRLGEIRSIAKGDYDGFFSTAMPFGSVDARSGGAGTVTAQGWVIDPDAVGGTGKVFASIDDRSVEVVANASRPDVGAAFPAYGAAHGFTAQLTGVPPGTHNLCLTFRNPGPGVDVGLGCQPVVVMFGSSGSPVGRITSLTAGIGQVTVTGWAVDPDTSAPLNVTVSSAGRSTTAAASRHVPELATLTPGVGTAHGFSVVLDGLPGGTIAVCVSAANVGPGVETGIGCASVAAPTGPPAGVLDAVTWDGATIRASGWAYDPDTAGPVWVELWVDGLPRVGVTANQNRPDLVAHLPGYGPLHGFSTEVTMALAPGLHSVCAKALDTTTTVGQELGGCTAINVPAPPPPPTARSEAVGAIQSLQGGRRAIGVSGWAADTVDTGPVWVWIVIDDRWYFTPANQPRWGFSFFFPRHGDAHGYGAIYPASRGAHRVCVASFTTDLKALTVQGCRNVRVT